MPFLRGVVTLVTALGLGTVSMAADDSAEPVYRASTVCGFSHPAPRLVVYALDAYSGDPLPGAHVVVDGPKAIRRKAITDAHGRAVLLDFGEGRLDVRIVLNGFAPARTEVEIGNACLVALTAPLHVGGGGHM